MTSSPGLPFALSSASVPRKIQLSQLKGWPVHPPADASPFYSWTPAHKPGSDEDKCSFILTDLHHLLFADLTATPILSIKHHPGRRR